ncbi:hypothetical protein H6504_01695 [Candidatus Woesearchaeota archaeon]|nr:hypothetical protein [Candidatus Woesearchaeota archaeon]
MQPILMISTLLVTIAVLVFGFNTVFSFTENANNAALLSFTTKLSGDLQVQSKSSSVSRLEYDVPSSVREICFLDKRAKQEHLPPLLVDRLQSNAKGNVIIETEDSTQVIQIDNLKFSSEPYYYCEDMSVKNRLELRLKGDLNGVTIYEPVSYYACETFDAERLEGFDPCAVLDERFWPGYQGVCCQEFNLCC